MKNQKSRNQIAAARDRFQKRKIRKLDRIIENPVHKAAPIMDPRDRLALSRLRNQRQMNRAAYQALTCPDMKSSTRKSILDELLAETNFAREAGQLYYDVYRFVGDDLDFKQILWRGKDGTIIGISYAGEFLADYSRHFTSSSKGVGTYAQHRHRVVVSPESALHQILCVGVPFEFRVLLNPLLDSLEGRL